ncbi:MAG: MspA family porin [Gordonia sp. (in: high G+C Gram-positive bacteria)]|uniref:MspA family porin n=1 Tax=Gordonia sp. (in: high G+C Gram-positive bacteria) TaxID=84139 RepID=UPI0039E6C559
MRKTMRNAVIAGAVVALGAAGTIGAGVADAAKLPSGSKTATGVDGQVVKITRKGESARVAHSVANNGAGRAAIVSGTYKATLSKGSGTLTVGYLVGCQVDITGLEGGLSGTIGIDSSLSGSLTIPLKPGQVAFVSGDSMPIKDGKSATLMVDSFGLDVQQCGGYASARSVAQVMAADGLSTEGDELSGTSGFVQSTLYGKPFSLG